MTLRFARMLAAIAALLFGDGELACGSGVMSHHTETDEPLPVDLGQHVGGGWLRPRCAQEGSGEGRDPMGSGGEEDGLHLQPRREVPLG